MVGSTNRQADEALIAEMQRFARGETFDERAMPGLDSEAIDFRAASESFAAVRRLGRKDLHTLRLVTPGKVSIVSPAAALPRPPPAVAWWVRRAGDADWRALAVDVLRIEDGRVAEIVTFGPDVFASFGFPATLADEEAPGDDARAPRNDAAKDSEAERHQREQAAGRRTDHLAE